MALTKLKISNNFPKRRALEPEDIRQAFLRAAKAQWGEDCPLEVKSVKNGSVRVAAPSAPWRAEALWSRLEIIDKINDSLGEVAVKKISVWWE